MKITMKPIYAGLIVWLILGYGGAAASGILTLYLQPGLNGMVDIKAISIMTAELLDTNGNVVQNAIVNSSTAQFNVSSIKAGDYFIRINSLADDLVPSRIDDPALDITQFVGQTLRLTVIGSLSDPTYTISMHSKGQGHHPAVRYADGVIETPEKYCYVLLYQKTSPQKIEIRVLGTAAELTSYTPGNAVHPSTSTATNPPFSTWIILEKSHGIDYDGNERKCSICHGNLDMKAATYDAITTRNGWCYRCHYGKGGDDNGFVDTARSVMATLPAPMETTQAATTTTAIPKSPAFEIIFTIGALLVAVARRRF